MLDQYGRTIDYMRISITDRCDLRCRYCMPEEGIEKVSMNRILTYEEILRICRAAVGIGITKFKVTGGEPLVRKGCIGLIREIKGIPGAKQVTLTTNGQQLVGEIDALADAGIDGINISLDSLKEDRYRYITGGGQLDKVLGAIDESIGRGIRTKVNCLLQKQFNEDEIIDFADFAFEKGIDVRFIEIMPVGFGNPDTGLPNDEVLRRLKIAYPGLEEDHSVHGNGPAVYYRLPLGAPASGGERNGGAIGLISAMHHRFCESCNRVRLTSQGQLKPCLCYEDSVDLRPALKGCDETTDDADKALKETLRRAIYTKPAGHTFHDRQNVEPRAMSQIGG